MKLPIIAFTGLFVFFLVNSLSSELKIWTSLEGISVQPYVKNTPSRIKRLQSFSSVNAVEQKTYAWAVFQGPVETSARKKLKKISASAF